MMTIERLVKNMAVVTASFALIWTSGCKADQESAGKKREPAPKATTSARTQAPMTAKAPALPVLAPATVLVDVDGNKLTVKEADEQIKPMLGANADKMGDDMIARLMPRLRQQAVERFVVRTLLTAEADRKGIKAEAADLDDAIATIKTRLPPGMTLNDALKKEGLTEPELRTNLVTEVRFKKLIESEVPTNRAPSDAEVSRYYEENKSRFVAPESVEARHILVKVPEEATAEVKTQKKAKAEDLRKQLVDGADFDKLARENSDCPSKTSGGNLGSFGRGQMVKPFEDAAFSQPVKQIGPVVETVFGYHIIEVLDRTAAKTNSLDEVKARLSETLKQRTQMETVNKYLVALRAKSKIAYDDSVKPAAEAPGGEAE